MNVSDARFGAKDQTVDLQVDALKKAACTNVYTEVISSAHTERLALHQLLEPFAGAMCWSSGNPIVLAAPSNV